MKRKSLNKSVFNYKRLIKDSDIQYVYSELIKFVYRLKTNFSNKFSDDYSVGNVLQGYMDYTYFYLTSDSLKTKKLKLGIVLNHSQARFELWLLGNTKDIQKKYWELFKNTSWVQEKEMPQYSIFEVTLIENPDFDNLDDLANSLEKKFISASNKIIKSLSRQK